jgi:hypothetical protein
MADRVAPSSNKRVHPSPPPQRAAATVVVVPRSGGGSGDRDGEPEKAGWQLKLEELSNRLGANAGDNGAEGEGERERPGRSDAATTREDGIGNTAGIENDDPLLSRFWSWKDGGAARWEQRAADVRAVSREAQRTIRRSAASALRERSEHNYRLQIAVTELNASRQALVEHLEQDVESHLAECKHELSVLESELERIQAEARNVLQEQEEDIPRLQHVILLYSCCTGIKWYDDPEEGDEAVPDDGREAPSSSNSAQARQKVWQGTVVRTFCSVVRVHFVLSPTNVPSRFLTPRLADVRCCSSCIRQSQVDGRCANLRSTLPTNSGPPTPCGES